MKILLVCAGGLSTALLMKKMEKYWQEQNEKLVIDASSLAEYKDRVQDFDMILVGPQIAYRLETIKSDSKLPCDVINSTDYALGKCDSIFAQAQKLYKS